LGTATWEPSHNCGSPVIVNMATSPVTSSGRVTGRVVAISQSTMSRAPADFFVPTSTASPVEPRNGPAQGLGCSILDHRSPLIRWAWTSAPSHPADRLTSPRARREAPAGRQQRVSNRVTNCRRSSRQGDGVSGSGGQRGARFSVAVRVVALYTTVAVMAVPAALLSLTVVPLTPWTLSLNVADAGGPSPAAASAARWSGAAPSVASRPPRRWPSSGWTLRPSTRSGSPSSRPSTSASPSPTGAGTSSPSRSPSRPSSWSSPPPGVTGSLWLIVAGLAGYGLKDLWQHRTGFVTGTRWWPPFCAVVGWVVAALIAVAITAGSSLVT
jgi:hypothetical protein